MSEQKVYVNKWEHVVEDGKSLGRKVPDGVAVFCAWGSDCEEFEFGVGTYSTAIIRRSDGSIENKEVSLIQFQTKEQTND